MVSEKSAQTCSPGGKLRGRVCAILVAVPRGFMPFRRYFSILVVLVCSFPLELQPQQSVAQQNSQPDTIKVQAAEVVVDAIVTDKRNHLVSNLKAEDFTVYENGAAQKLSSFHIYRGGSPASVKEQEQTGPTATSAPPAPAPQQPPTLTILLLDYSTVELQNQKLVREASMKYVR